MKTGIQLIAEERSRHEKKYDAKHDAEHINGELAAAGASYALWNWSRTDSVRLYPFDEPLHAKLHSIENVEQSINRLSKAGALIAAEIDRLQNI
jgi:hypothetical protein